MDSIGIMAGSGQFPFLVARGARKNGLRVVICGFHGNTDPALAEEADNFLLLPLGQLDRLIDFFKTNGVSKVCMAGAVNKPAALDVKPDFRAAKLLFKLAGNKGDDAILRALAGELQSEGIAVLRPDDLVPGLVTCPGVLTKNPPDAETWRDIRIGWTAAKAVGSLDIGQCVVVRNGIITAVEAIEGTDAAIARGASLGGPGCTVVKTRKPGQDARLDLPSIGAGTVALLAAHHCVCLAFDAGGTLFFDREKALPAAEDHGISLVALPDDPAALFAANMPEI